MNSVLSRLTVSSVGLTCKAFLNVGYCSSVTVHGLEHLKAALHNHERGEGRGVITISNHISTLDDPVTWGILPTGYFFISRLTRWSLGASDIIFTNPVFSSFFRKGQVLETFRGNGIFQPAVSTAIEKLNDGSWIHLFGEGKVNQSGDDPEHLKSSPLLRFKWGVGRILMEAQKPPLIIPMWLSGFENLMPEGRPIPWKFFPKPGVALSVTFGKPICPSSIKAAFASAVHGRNGFAHKRLATEQELALGVSEQERRSLVVSEEGWLGDDLKTYMSTLPAESVKNGDAEPAEAALVKRETARIRSAITALLHREVEALGRRVMNSERRS